VEAGVVDCGAVAAEHGDGVRGRAAAGPFEACHLVSRRRACRPVQSDGAFASKFENENENVQYACTRSR